jgi:type I restriction enzyme M protein
MPPKILDYASLGNWLWEAACAIRGPIDAPRFKNYILPLVFIKRLSDVFDDELARVAEDLGDADLAADLVEQDHAMVRFYMPPIARWGSIRQQATGLGEYLTEAVRAVGRANAAKLGGVLDRIDYNETAAGQRIVDDARLARLVQVLSRQRLGLADVEPDILGRAYEYLLGKFAEGSGQSAGEFYTPRAVGVLMARMLDPQPGMGVYDPCCGSGGLLIKCHLRLLETHGTQQNGRLALPSHLAKLGLHGQEIQPDTYSLARMNTLIHDLEADIRLGDTMARPAFTRDDGSLASYDLVTANPMWNQNITAATYENDPYHRFGDGTPPASSADWGWVQHMYASLNDGGRMAVVLDTGAVARGSGNQGANKERDLRKAFVEADRVEAVILLPENLFVNTTAPGIVMVLNQRKRHPGEILLVNASKLFAKGRPKNELQEEHIEQVHDLYAQWRAEEGLSAVIETAEAARNDYNLSPSRYVAQNGGEEVLPLEDAVVLLNEAEEERAQADAALRQVLASLGLETGTTE